MLIAALRAKLRARGPLGFAADAAELALACGAIAGLSVVLLAALVAGAALGLPVAALDWAVRRGADGCQCVNSFDECRCGRGER